MTRFRAQPSGAPGGPPDRQRNGRCGAPNDPRRRRSRRRLRLPRRRRFRQTAGKQGLHDPRAGTISRPDNLDLRLDEASALLLSRRASPASIDNAIWSAARIGGSAADAASILRGGLCALGGAEPLVRRRRCRSTPRSAPLTSTWLNWPVRSPRSRSLALSFLFSGPPGTGKSAYARHLAERLCLDVLEKRYSDLCSMWLGKSEKTIALAFEEAADLRAFLVFDEAELAAARSSGGEALLGGDTGQRDADAHGASRLPLRVHDQRAGPSRSCHLAALLVQGGIERSRYRGGIGGGAGSGRMV